MLPIYNNVDLLYCWTGSVGAAVHTEQKQTLLFDEYQGQDQRDEFLMINLFC